MSEESTNRSSTLGFAGLVLVSATIVATSGFIPGLSGVAAAQDVDIDDSATIRARVEAYRDTWNTHDATALAAFFTEDADFVMGNVPAVRGREEIRHVWQDYFKQQEPERRLTLDVDPVRFVADNIAVVNVLTTTGGRNHQGLELHARKFRGTWVLQRKNGTWLIAALRGLPDEGDRVVLNASAKAAQTLRPRIRAFVRAYEGAFNTHDPAALTTLYTDDADIVVRNSPVIHGRQAILNWWRTYFSQSRPYRFIPIVDEIRMMSSDVALINVTATGASQQPDAAQSSVRYARATWVVVRKEGKWLIAALRVLPSEDDHIIRGGRDSN